MRIIYDINHHFLKVIEKKWPGDVDKLRRLSVIEEGFPKMVRMANLAIIGSHAVNGVAQIHSDLLKNDVFPEFYTLWPKKFLNMTNGVTPRRWLHQANPDLSMILTSYLRTPNWIFNLDLLAGLRNFADNTTLQKQWALMKLQNKEKLAKMIFKKTGIAVTTDALFDTQVKRIHEYKRQLLNILYIIHRYNTIKGMSNSQRKSAGVVPRVVIFGGKAAPGYYMAKLVIQLINSVAKVINNDADIGDLLKVVFIPNYCVSLAEIIVPGSDLSQHISTAGMEASGTSNMKFAMNGCLIIGTLDGANVEIEQEIGSANIFIFGAKEHEVEPLRKQCREGKFPAEPRLAAVLELIEADTFGDAVTFQPIVNALKPVSDYYLLNADFAAYCEAQEKVDATWRNQQLWTRMSIMSTAGSGKFSSDRTIKQYAEQIWDIKTQRRPGPVPVSVERLGSLGIISAGALKSLEDDAGAISLERMTPKERLSVSPSMSPQLSPANH